MKRGRKIKFFVVCKECGQKKHRSQFYLKKSKYKHGKLRDNLCKECAMKVFYRNTGRVYKLLLKKEICEMCDFKGLQCQLDIHHIDGNRNNNKRNNLKVLCANCHRLVSFVQRGGETP